MKIEGQYTFNVSQETLWNALLDPVILSKTLPGCEELEEVGENDYRGVMNIGIGPVQGRFDGQFSILDINPLKSYQLKLGGRGPSGFVEGKGEIRLETEDNSTILHYTIDAQVGGLVAGVGQRLLESSARSIARQSLEQLHQLVTTQHKSESSGIPSQGVESPSESQLAAGIAQDFLRSISSRKRRILSLLAIITILAILLILYFKTFGT